MLFNSPEFLFIFLPLVLLLWWSLRGSAIRVYFLVLASLFFYGWWNWRFVPLMLATASVDYFAAKRICAATTPQQKKFWLLVSVVSNLAALGFFKYYGLFGRTLNSAILALGGGRVLPLIDIVLPIGISFYTFNSLSYTIDVYRNVIEPAPSLVEFVAFVSMFPHLIAGPIVRYADIGPQLRRLKSSLPAQQAATGAFYFSVGLAKKLLIADQLASAANAYFASDFSGGFVSAWLGVFAYSFELYFDFSGYSDMAIGLAHFLGFQFPQNFNSPYKAENISDFWRRWHITLSSWLQDYLFIPLGGSRDGYLNTGRNIVLTMLLGGLWHGANWTFALWGLYHGFLLSAHNLWRKWFNVRVPTLVGRATTLIFVVVGWVLFRSNDLSTAKQVLRSMSGARGLGHFSLSVLETVVLALAAVIALGLPNTTEIQLTPRPAYAVGLALLLAASILFLAKGSPFLYFQF